MNLICMEQGRLRVQDFENDDENLDSLKGKICWLVERICFFF